jgi:hypothetical protein
MEDILGFVLIIITLLINILAIIISDYTERCLICHVWRLHDVNFILIVNTYMPILFTSFLHTSLNIQAILGDIHLLINIYSTSCQVWGYIYLYVIMWFFKSFSVQAYICMLNIWSPTRTHLHSFMGTIIFIIIIWFGTLLLLIPTIFLRFIAYQPSEYQCIVDLRTWKGNIYMILSVYSIPITITVMIYVRVVRFMKKSSVRNQQHRHATILRDVMVLQRIVILVGTLIVLDLPPAIFLDSRSYHRTSTSSNLSHTNNIHRGYHVHFGYCCCTNESTS